MGYIILKTNRLYQVSCTDHLTIIGHSIKAKTLQTVKNDDAETGCYIQGDTAEECVRRLIRAGLRCAPKILSLECRHAAVANGIAVNLSRHPVFKNSLIEANTGAIGRNVSTNMTIDTYGRIVMNEDKNPWFFFLDGTIVTKETHGTYTFDQILEKTAPPMSCQPLSISSRFRFFCGPANQNSSQKTQGLVI
jgi:hypothetical protein